MVVALIAIVGAFASNQSLQDKVALVDRIGYTKDGNNCIPTAVVCSNIFNPQLCTSGATILFDWNGTDCVMPLYRKI